MKISICDGKVVCSREEENGEFLHDYTIHEFLHDVYPFFDGYYKGKLKMRTEEKKDGWAFPEVPFLHDADTLKRILKYADVHGIEVDDSVRVLNEEWQARANEIEENRKSEEEEKKAKAYWEKKKKECCLSCPYLRKSGDDYFCGFAKEILDFKWLDPSEGYGWFVTTAIPNGNCKYAKEGI